MFDVPRWLCVVKRTAEMYDGFEANCSKTKKSKPAWVNNKPNPHVHSPSPALQLALKIPFLALIFNFLAFLVRMDGRYSRRQERLGDRGCMNLNISNKLIENHPTIYLLPLMISTLILYEILHPVWSTIKKTKKFDKETQLWSFWYIYLNICNLLEYLLSTNDIRITSILWKY